jgi:predicted RNA binding protein YcfA (HicA-like mRNA interferase family)
MGRIRKGREIDAALYKKGFQRVIDGDHVYYCRTDSGVKTKISHGMKGRDLGPELLGIMARQLHLTKAQFLD